VKRSIIRFAARLYPAAWRERYAAELDVLLEDMGLNWRDLGDVLGGALATHMTAWSFLRLAFICGLAGAIIAGCGSQGATMTAPPNPLTAHVSGHLFVCLQYCDKAI